MSPSAPAIKIRSVFRPIGFLFYIRAGGLAIAKQEGRMGSPEIQHCADFASIVKDWQDGKIAAVETMKQAGKTQTTFYRKVKAMQQ